MNLDTLLEAAKFLELRDQMLNDNFNAASTTTTTTATGVAATITNTTSTATSAVYTSSNVSAGALQSTKLGTFGGSGGPGTATTTTTIMQKGTISDPIPTIQSSLNLLTNSGTGIVGAKGLGGTSHQGGHLSPTVINISSSVPSESARQPPTVLSHRKRAFESNNYASASSTVISSNLSQNVTSHNGTSSSQTKKEQDGHISSTTMNQTQRHRLMQSSFDIMKPLVIDESGPVETKRSKPTPMPFRAGTREVHNKLEKHRRAQLKECFDALKKQLPENTEERKSSNLSILHSAVKTIEELKEQERQFSIEMERLGQEKVALNTRLATLRKDSSLRNVDVSRFLSEISSSSTHNGHSKRDSLSDSLLSTSPSLSNSSIASPRPRSSASPSFTVVEPTTFNICGDSDSFCDLKNESSLPLMNLGNASNVVTVTANPGMVTIAGSSVATVSSSDSAIETRSSMIGHNNSVITATNGGDPSKLSIPILSKNYPIVTTTTPQPIVSKEVTDTGISVVPVSYPVSQGLVLQKVAILPPKGVTELTPLMQTHFISPPLNGQISKVVPITQYIVKPMVVVSTANQRPGS